MPNRRASPLTANNVGQLGNGQTWGTAFYAVAGAPTGFYARPQKSDIQNVALGTENALAVVAGDAFACALRATGGVSCWGSNEAGQSAQRARGGIVVALPTFKSLALQPGAHSASHAAPATCVLPQL
jgi:alpha-tubulin suppressor-like RCC1 family protein